MALGSCFMTGCESGFEWLLKKRSRLRQRSWTVSRSRRRKKGDCCGYDASKKINGRKRHLIVDTLGVILAVVVHEGSVQDRDGTKRTLRRLMGRLPHLSLIWADGG